jgi:hypothetical protein
MVASVFTAISTTTSPGFILADFGVAVQPLLHRYLIFLIDGSLAVVVLFAPRPAAFLVVFAGIAHLHRPRVEGGDGPQSPCAPQLLEPGIVSKFAQIG